MGLFSDMLKSDESLFKNHVALDYDYVPKNIPYREAQQKTLAGCIRPLMMNRNGKNILMYGPSGVGKTVACKHLFQELEAETDEVFVVYLNCWQRNTSYKILIEMCEILGYRMTVNKKSDELFKAIKRIINKKAAVFCFDEADKIEDFDFMYMILEEIYRKSIFLITNHREWLLKVDPRIKSRLTPDAVEFPSYTPDEIRGILELRKEHAFYDGVWDPAGFEIIADVTAQARDLRIGLYLLREAANIAEANASKIITADHTNQALDKMDHFAIKNTDLLDEDSRLVLSVIEKNTGSKIGDLHKLYLDSGGCMGYKTFTRKIAKLEKTRFITIKKTSGGPEGNTSIINFVPTGKGNKLTDY